MTQANLADDLLSGTQEIAQFFGYQPRQVYYLLERGILPGFKIGRKWHARKSRLLDHIDHLEQAG